MLAALILSMPVNGSLMRLAPIPLFYYFNMERAQTFAVESSRTTHGASECLDACRLFCKQLLRALAGEDKQRILFADTPSFAGQAKIIAIANGDYRQKTEETIRGTGYVVLLIAWKRLYGVSGLPTTLPMLSSKPLIWEMMPTRQRLFVDKSPVLITATQLYPLPGKND